MAAATGLPAEGARPSAALNGLFLRGSNLDVCSHGKFGRLFATIKDCGITGHLRHRALYTGGNRGRCQRGAETKVSRESAVEAQSAEKWMRTVDTDTADFLRSRFMLESARRGEL